MFPMMLLRLLADEVKALAAPPPVFSEAVTDFRWELVLVLISTRSLKEKMQVQISREKAFT